MSWVAIMTIVGPVILNMDSITLIGLSGQTDPAHPNYGKTAISGSGDYVCYVDSPVDKVTDYMNRTVCVSLSEAGKNFMKIVENSKREPADASA
jgi:hypothetical protein